MRKNKYSDTFNRSHFRVIYLFFKTYFRNKIATELKSSEMNNILNMIINPNNIISRYLRLQNIDVVCGDEKVISTMNPRFLSLLRGRN